MPSYKQPSTNNHLPIRTRFAPSPTGFMHVGSVRTALFAWLLTRQDDGQLVLRIEDTDQKREAEGSVEHIIKSLNALGLIPDESPENGGPHAPYKQSERLDIYKKWAQKLIDDGRAYADPYTAEELQTFRDQARATKQPFLYRNNRPDSLDSEPPAWDGTTPLRFKSDPKSYTWNDLVMGDINTGPEVVDDFILIKSDGFPTYNFAHIVDDAEMEITHVIRGQEFISSMPNYLNLYEALEVEHPQFATMPHILAESGGKKLSKRDGAKDILDYIRDGYLPEALINFIASMGWNDGTEQEVFSVNELINKFSLERVQKSGARFDEKRLNWLNGQHIRRLSLDELYKLTENFWSQSAESASEEQKKQVLGLVQDRLKTLSDIPTLTNYFFEEPKPNWSMVEENKQLSKLSKAELKNLLITILSALETTEFNPKSIQNTLNDLLESTSQKPVILFGLLRIAVTWAPFSPSLNDTLAILGKEVSLSRLKQASSLLSEL